MSFGVLFIYFYLKKKEFFLFGLVLCFFLEFLKFKIKKWAVLLSVLIFYDLLLLKRSKKTKFEGFGGKLWHHTSSFEMKGNFLFVSYAVALFKRVFFFCISVSIFIPSQKVADKMRLKYLSFLTSFFLSENSFFL